MKHTLFIAKFMDDRRSAYSYMITNYEGIKASGSFVTLGKRNNQNTDYRALQRALKSVSQLLGVVDLKIIFDQSLIQIAYEMVEVDEPKCPEITETTARTIRRFKSCEYATTDFSDINAIPEEVYVMDTAVDLLSKYSSITGNVRLLTKELFGNKIFIY
ncbi:hypothetical protein [Bacillus pumilus]|uniref:hypothetical protein n=1 Tax=Bacillus pumilus TaxID=1408 RepID=UPI000DE58B45|nr:hypothetical protein [Bacillus pumilus]